MSLKSQYRITAGRLMDTLDNWDGLMNFRVRMIACGGTALTLLELKESTKDIDFVIPDIGEYEKLIKFLGKIGYREKPGGWAHTDDPLFLYQFWYGNRVFITDLLDSPLREGKHVFIKEWRHIYLGVLNLLDLIITKVFRGTQVDMEDCIRAFQGEKIDPQELFARYVNTASYDLNPDQKMQYFKVFVGQLASRSLVGPDFLAQVRAGS